MSDNNQDLFDKPYPPGMQEPEWWKWGLFLLGIAILLALS